MQVKKSPTEELSGGSLIKELSSLGAIHERKNTAKSGLQLETAKPLLRILDVIANDLSQNVFLGGLPLGLALLSEHGVEVLGTHSSTLSETLLAHGVILLVHLGPQTRAGLVQHTHTITALARNTLGQVDEVILELRVVGLLQRVRLHARNEKNERNESKAYMYALCFHKACVPSREA